MADELNREADMSLVETARAMLDAGRSVEAVRQELRSSVLGHGEPPTCSAVEEAIRQALPRVFFFGCWDDSGHYVWRPSHGALYHANADCPFDARDLDSGMLLPRPERVGFGSLVHLRGWTILSWWGNSPWDKRPNVNSAILVKGKYNTDEVWARFTQIFPTLAEKLTRPKIVDDD